MKEITSKTEIWIDQFLASKWIPVWIFLAGVTVFMVGLSPEFTGFDCRAAMFAQEMLRNGPTFFPTTYGQPYPDYTAASTFMIYLASLLFGKVTPLTAILPTAVVSALILVVTYRIGAIRSKTWGLFAVLLALFTKEFLGLSRSISYDQYTSLATVLCFYIAYSGTVYDKQKRLWFIPLLFIASFAFRGPIGIVIPAAVVGAYYFFNLDFKRFSFIVATFVILFLLCSKGLLAAAAYQGGAAFKNHVWVMQVASRMGEGGHWFGYYWINSFAKYAVVYPFAVIVIASRLKEIFQRRNPDYQFIAYLVVWLLVVLIGMSIPGSKRMRYIVPMAPAAALIASYLFVEPLQNDILLGTKKVFLEFCSWFPLGTVLVVLAARAIRKQLGFHFEVSWGVVVFTFVMAIAAGVLKNRIKESSARDLAFVAIGVTTFLAINIGIKEVISYNRDRTGPFVQKVTALQEQRPGEIVFYKINEDGDAIKFMANLNEPIQPHFISSPEAILSFNEPAYFIATDKDLADLPRNVLQHTQCLDCGKIGNTECEVFTPLIMEDSGR